jgi:hypothetical protein
MGNDLTMFLCDGRHCHQQALLDNQEAVYKTQIIV